MRDIFPEQTEASPMCERPALTISPELMSSVVASHAKTLAEPGKELVSEASAAAYGLSLSESLASYDRDSQSWKTFQICLSGEWEQFLGTWPKSGMTRNGIACELTTSVRHICGSECLLWPTPHQSMGKRGWHKNGAEQLLRGEKFRKSGARIGSSLNWEPRLLPEYKPGFHVNPAWVEWLMGFPVGYTELAPSEMQSFRQKRSGSRRGSKKA